MAKAPDKRGFARTLAAAQDGDEAAWADLYDWYSPAVLGYLRSERLAQPEDVLGEVWVSVVRDVHGFRGGRTRFQSWLLTIAHNRVVDSVRHANARPPESSDPVPDLGVADQALANLDEQDVDLLQRVFSSLPESQRRILWLRTVLGLPFREIARITGSSTAAVKMAHGRALRTASDAISTDSNGPDDEVSN